MNCLVTVIVYLVICSELSKEAGFEFHFHVFFFFLSFSFSFFLVSSFSVLFCFLFFLLLPFAFSVVVVIVCYLFFLFAFRFFDFSFFYLFFQLNFELRRIISILSFSNLSSFLLVVIRFSPYFSFIIIFSFISSIILSA